MDTLYIGATDDTPEILLDKGKRIFRISGRSLPEDAVEFYRPVLEWIERYKNEPDTTTDFEFKLDYVNTASSKLVQDVMLALEKIEGAKILWYCQDGDEDMEAMGQEYSELIGLPFEFKSY
jgi:hypothetical protein